MPELIVYTSPTCGPCRTLKPKLIRLQETHGFDMKFVELSVKTQAAFQAMGIRSVPTIAGMDGTELLGVAMGDMTDAAAEVLLRGWKVIK